MSANTPGRRGLRAPFFILPQNAFAGNSQVDRCPLGITETEMGW